MNDAQILIVEDEILIAEYIGVVLTRSGYRIAGVAASGEEAVAATLRVRPDLVLMDIQINGAFDGITAATRIKEQADIPIVYLTAHVNRSIKTRAEATRPYGYLVKPFRSTSLIAIIETALGDWRREAAVR